MLSKFHSVAAVTAALAGVLAANVADSQSAFRKLSAIESGAAAPGAQIRFTQPELNGWMIEEARAHVPRGVRNLRLNLSGGRATGYADIDFVKLRQAGTGEEPGWIAKNLLAGERPVMVTARFQSRNGRARVDVERVEISGIAIEGHALDFVIEDYLRPTFPDVKVDQWFGLRYGIDRFTLGAPGVIVFMASQRRR